MNMLSFGSNGVNRESEPHVKDNVENDIGMGIAEVMSSLIIYP